MNPYTFFLAADTPALQFAGEFLSERGYPIVEAPSAQVHNVLLGVPSFNADGTLKGGGSFTELLANLPSDARIFGGNLDPQMLSDRKFIDLLCDPIYLAENADITAHCAVSLAMSRLSVTLKGCPVLVLGWGRIGKCLSKLLAALGANVSVAARKEVDRAMLRTLGYGAEDPAGLSYGLMRYRLIFNTIPARVLSSEQAALCRDNCLLIDLASKTGIESGRAIQARGLPAKYAPESSGKLIAKSVIRLCAMNGGKA